MLAPAVPPLSVAAGWPLDVYVEDRGAWDVLLPAWQRAVADAYFRAFPPAGGQIAMDLAVAIAEMDVNGLAFKLFQFVGAGVGEGPSVRGR